MCERRINLGRELSGRWRRRGSTACRQLGHLERTPAARVAIRAIVLGSRRRDEGAQRVLEDGGAAVAQRRGLLLGAVVREVSLGGVAEELVLDLHGPLEELLVGAHELEVFDFVK